jgi:Ca-activated chloride channel homolog
MGIKIDKDFIGIEGAKDSSTVIVLDISLSMLAEDIQPNRIEKAKEIIHTFLTKELNSKIALIIFAGKPIILSPFSTDILGIQNIVKNISPYMIRQEDIGLSGTAIGDALLLAEKILWKQSGEKKIILITDGRTNVWINPKDIIDTSEIKSSIYTIGIGQNGSGELFYTNKEWKKQFIYDESGSILRTDIDIESLRYLAEKTKGKYFSGEISEIPSNLWRNSLDMPANKDTPITWYILLSILLLYACERILVIWIERKYLWKRRK